MLRTNKQKEIMCQIKFVPNNHIVFKVFIFPSLNFLVLFNKI